MKKWFHVINEGFCYESSLSKFHHKKFFGKTYSIPSVFAPKKRLIVKKSDHDYMALPLQALSLTTIYVICGYKSINIHVENDVAFFVYPITAVLFSSLRTM